MPDGTRIRKNFAEKTEAEQARSDYELEAAGQAEAKRALRTSLTPEQLLDAEGAVQLLGERSMSKELARLVNLEARARGKGATLDQAIAFFETRYRPESEAVTVMNAINEFLKSRAGVGKATLRNYESSLGLLLKADPNKFVHAFTVGEIEKAAGKYENLNSRRTHRRIFSIFFNWCVRHHYCLEDPCKRLDKLPKDMSQIAALTLGEVKRLLYAATRIQDGTAAATVAIGIFAGLRPSEIKDLNSEDIGERGIRVSGGKLRRKLKRTVPVPPVLAAWLKRYPFTGQPKGWNYKMKALKKATKAAKWVQDIVRHTSITFQTERDKNEGTTAFNCGTSIQMMNRHYRNTIDDAKTVTEFWDLTPEKLLEKKPEITLPEKKKIAWPDKAALKKLVWLKPLIHAAADIGVSDVAMKKHCVKLGIELPAQGYWLRERRDEAK
jgi:integrase